MLGFRRANSGEERYLANSFSQSAEFIGGREPVTGRQSVILKLFDGEGLDVVYKLKTYKCTRVTAYPDSVSRVNPPKTTIPNTLAALPSNQYPTTLLVVSGKNAVLALVLASFRATLPDADPASIARIAIRRPRLSKGENTVPFRCKDFEGDETLVSNGPVLRFSVRPASLRMECDCNPYSSLKRVSLERVRPAQALQVKKLLVITTRAGRRDRKEDVMARGPHKGVYLKFDVVNKKSKKKKINDVDDKRPRFDRAEGTDMLICKGYSSVFVSSFKASSHWKVR